MRGTKEQKHLAKPRCASHSRESVEADGATMVVVIVEGVCCPRRRLHSREKPLYLRCARRRAAISRRTSSTVSYPGSPDDPRRTGGTTLRGDTLLGDRPVRVGTPVRDSATARGDNDRRLGLTARANASSSMYAVGSAPTGPKWWPTAAVTARGER